MLEIQKITLEKDLKYKSSIILKYSISYPKINSNTYIYGVEKFNHFNQIQAFNNKLYAEKNLYFLAKSDYDYNTANGYPTFPYEFSSDFTVTFNEKYIISLFQKDYTFTGGAHGSTVVSAQNWNILLRKEIFAL